MLIVTSVADEWTNSQPIKVWYSTLNPPFTRLPSYSSIGSYNLRSLKSRQWPDVHVTVNHDICISIDSWLLCPILLLHTYLLSCHFHVSLNSSFQGQMNKVFGHSSYQNAELTKGETLNPETSMTCHTHYCLSIKYCIARKCWLSLNLAVWPQTESKKYWQNLNLVVAPRCGLHHHKRCTCVYQGAMWSSRLKYLN